MWSMTAEEYKEIADHAKKKAKRYRNGEIREGGSYAQLSGRGATTYINGKKYTWDILQDMAREQEELADKYYRKAKDAK